MPQNRLEWIEKINAALKTMPKDSRDLYLKSSTLFSCFVKLEASEDEKFMLLFNLISGSYDQIDPMVSGGYANEGYYFDYYFPKYIKAIEGGKQFISTLL